MGKRALRVAVILWLVVISCLAAASADTPLIRARQALDEKSYAIAARYYDEALAGNLSPAERREALYGRALVSFYLGESDQARTGFEKLVTEPARDRWRGLALWRLVLLQARGGVPADAATSVSQAISEAQKLIREFSAADYGQFLRSIVNDVLPQWTPFTPAEQQFQLELIDQAIAATKNEADAAQLLRRKADFRRSHSSLSEEQYMEALRTIVAEFPKTTAAREAQVTVARWLSNQNRLPEAVEAWKKVRTLWPHTQEAREADEALDQITRQFVDVDLPSLVYPDDPVVARIAARNTPRCKVSFYRIEPETAPAAFADPGDLAQMLAGRPAVLERTIALKARNDYRGTTASLVLDPKRSGERLEPGLYIVRGESEKATCYRLIVVGNLALLSNMSGATLHVWTVNASDGKPRSGAKILVRWWDRSGSARAAKAPLKGAPAEVHELTADSNGFAQMKLTTATLSKQFDAVAISSQECALLTDQYPYYWRSDERQTLCYVYTDRPAYRPGDTVNWKAVVRAGVQGRYELMPPGRYRVTITTGRGETFQTQEVEASPSGTLTASFALTASVPLGMWTINVGQPAGRNLGSARFRVEEYRKPEFEVTVSAAEKLVRWESKADVEVQARYLFGAPVAGGAVHYTVTAQPRFWWALPDPWLRDLDWFAETDTPSWRSWEAPRVRVAEGEGTTDADGRYRFSFTASAPRDARPWQSGFWDFTVVATVTDASRRAVDGTVIVPVGEHALRVNVVPERRVVRPGDLLRMVVRTSNLAGEPVAAQGRLAFEKLVWDDSKKEDACTTVATTSLTISEAGESAAEWRVPEDFHGRLRVVFLTDDPFGGLASGWGIVNVATADTQDLGVHYQGVQLIFDKETYEIGDTARVLVLSEYPNASAWFWIDCGNGIIDSRLLALRYRTNLVEVPITEGFVPNVRAGVIAVRNKRVLTDNVEIRVPPKRQVLDVVVTPDRTAYRPREEGTLKLQVRSWDGKPVQAEFSLSVYDKAIEYIQKSTRDDIRKFFYGRPRPVPMNLGISLDCPARHRINVPPPTSYDYEVLSPTPPTEGFLRDASFGGAMSELKFPQSVAMRKIGGAEMPMAEANEADSGGAELAEALLRTDFRDSILWLPTVTTDEQGRARVKVRFPDSLTTWRIEAVGIDGLARVGEYSTTTLVQKRVLARLITPRFLVERDEAVISAIVRNDLPTTKTVHVRFGAQGVHVESGEDTKVEQRREVAPGAETRLDWSVRAEKSGSATFRVTALTDVESDATETSIPVIAHGIDKKVFRVGATTDVSTGSRQIERHDGKTIIRDEIDIPEERISTSTRLTLRLTPSLAAQIREALPYLVDYPYGCVEQTMSRFLPAVVVARTFQELNIPRDELLTQRLPEVLKAGLKRLSDFQNPDGSWGWWKGGPPDDYMTAHVMYGLTLARAADVAVPDDVFNRGMAYMAGAVKAAGSVEPPTSDWQGYLRQRQLHALAYQTLVLTMNRQLPREAVEPLWNQRDALSPAGLAMLGRTLARVGDPERAKTVLRNLMNFAVVADANDTLHWESRPGSTGYWWWWNDRVEATAMALEAFIEIAPESPEIDRAVKWLVLNRRGSQWKSTKDTGLAVLALTDVLRQRRPDAEPTQVTVTMGRDVTREYSFTKDNFYTPAPPIVLEGADVLGGRLPVRIEVQGRAPVYYTLTAEYFTQEEPITKSGHEVYVERTFERCASSEKSADGTLHDRWEPLHDGDTLASGDRIRVTLAIRALNDYEYLVFEDPKPAGCEPVQVQSGWGCHGTLCGYTEFRDKWVAFFVDHLAQGEHRIDYELRAETPGTFHVLPARGYAMYFPDLYGNSDEVRITIRDKAR